MHRYYFISIWWEEIISFHELGVRRLGASLLPLSDSKSLAFSLIVYKMGKVHPYIVIMEMK